MAKQIIPDGAYHSGLSKDYGGKYNPDYDPDQETRLQNDREWRIKLDWQKNRIKELRSALGFALEMQESVEQIKPEGYGTPENTNAWMDEAKAILRLPVD